MLRTTDGRPSVLSANSGYGPTVATDATGDQTVAWTDAHYRTVVRTREAHGVWGAPAVLAAPRSQTVWLSVSRSGDAIIARAATGHPGGHELVAFRRGPHGAWGHPVAVGRGWFPAGALDARGAATIVWPTLITAHHSGFNVVDAASRDFH